MMGVGFPEKHAQDERIGSEKNGLIEKGMMMTTFPTSPPPNVDGGETTKQLQQDKNSIIAGQFCKRGQAQLFAQEYDDTHEEQDSPPLLPR